MKNPTYNETLEHTARLISSESNKLIKEVSLDENKNLNFIAYEELTIKIIEHLSSTLIYDGLNDYKNHPSLKKQEQYTFTSEIFSRVKGKLQLAMATSFEKAFLRYSKKMVDYYCIIKPMPKAINKEPC